MKYAGLIIFMIIVLAVYASINYYIFARSNQVLQALPRLKIPFYILFAFVATAFFVHVFLIRYNPSSFSSIFTWTGSFWLGAMAYLFLFIVFIDFIRAINHFLPFFPAFITNNYEKTKLITAITVFFAVAVVITAGYINALNPKLKEINITINKNSKIENLRIVAASDIHLGSIINNHRITEMVEKINALNPDIVLFPGDILDETVEPVLKFKSGEPIKKIKSKYGMFAITGNHEYIGGIKESAPYIESLNIHLLRDSVELIDNSFYIIGREDRSGKGFSAISRKPLIELIKEIDNSKPLILLDHQPLHLEEAEQNGIDFQLSGHTHNGQLWPFNYIAQMIYEISWGYLRKGNTQYYVSCGYGTWGPPIRTGNTPELLLINLKFKN